MFLSALCIHLDNGRCVCFCVCVGGGIDRELINDHANMGRIQYSVKKKTQTNELSKGHLLGPLGKGKL